jgi:hypothetical protein
MKRITIALALVLALALTLPAAAEVEEITVGGDIQIRGQVLTPGLNGPDWWFDDDFNTMDWATQRTRLNVDAALSGGVRGFVELQAYDFWGVDVDDVEPAAIDPYLPFPELEEQLTSATDLFAGQGNEFVKLYQAYIEMNDIADYPVQVRVGRQELTYGREWLVGNNDAGMNFSGLAFDAVKVRYADDMFAVDAWYAKLLDLTSPLQLGLLGEVEEDGDMDFYGVYGSYMGLEGMTIDAYWLYLRSGIEMLGFDTDDVVGLHTVGARLAGTLDLEAGMLDYGIEGAAQFGSNNVPEDFASNDSGDFGGWAFNAMAGFTFATDYSPRIEAEYAYFSGDDDWDDGDTDEFVRMFSDVHYGELNFGGNLDRDATNLHIVRIGASAKPCEKSKVRLDVLYFLLAEDDVDGGAKTFGYPQYGTSDPDDTVGWELDLAVDYQYTEDLLLTLGWAHFFADDALDYSWGTYDGSSADDVDYGYIQAKLIF